MKKISLISVYNNRQLLDEMVESCRTQTVGFENIEFISIDNTGRRFSSAAAALNYGSSQATTDICIFLHQDIAFLENDALQFIIDYLDQHPNAVIGSAGVKGREYGHDGTIISAMVYGSFKAQYQTAQVPEEAFTLDECLFGCKKALLGQLRFDEVLCDSWHLYGADLCLQALVKGCTVVVLPLPQVWHKSCGNADRSYIRTQNALGKKYRKHFCVVNTTNGYVYTNPIKRTALNLYRTLRYRKNYL